MNPRHLTRALGLVVVLVAAVVLSIGLTEPFDDSDQGWSGGYYGLAARNLVRYGPVALLGAMCVEPGAVVEAPLIYANHPPGIAWVVAAGFAVFGEGPLGARVGPWLLSIGAAGFFYGLLLRVLERPGWAAAGALLAAGTPAWVYYGSLPDPQGSGVLFAVLGACWAAAGWRESGSRRDAVLLGGFLVAGFLMDWPAYFAAVLLAAWAWAQPGGRRLAVRLLGLTAVSAGVTAAWITAVYGRRGGGPDIVEGFFNRTGLKGLLQGGLLDDLGDTVSAGDLLAGITRHHLDAGWWPLSLLGIVGLTWVARRWRSAVGLLAIPAVVGALHVLVFPQGAYVHQYWQLYLVVGLILPLVYWVCLVTPAELRAGMLTGLVALVVLSGVRGVSRAEVRWRWTELQRDAFPEMGAAIQASTQPHERLVSESTGHVALDYYADRKISWRAEPEPGMTPLLLPQGWVLWRTPP